MRHIVLALAALSIIAFGAAAGAGLVRADPLLGDGQLLWFDDAGYDQKIQIPKGLSRSLSGPAVGEGCPLRPAQSLYSGDRIAPCGLLWLLKRTAQFSHDACGVGRTSLPYSGRV